jgi:hypothetical protein
MNLSAGQHNLLQAALSDALDALPASVKHATEAMMQTFPNR